MGKSVTNAEIVKMYEKKGCNVSATCLGLGIDRSTFYKRKDKSAELTEKLESIDESILDFAESKLIEHIQDGDITSLILEFT